MEIIVVLNLGLVMVMVIVKNNNMQVVRRYNFKAAWPVSWEGPSFNSQSNELAIESVELAHDGIEVQVIQ